VVIAAATAIHDSLAAWPWAAEVLTTDGFLSRLGESALRVVEAIVAGAIDHGCTPEQAVQLYRSIWYYTVGEILVRAHSGGRRSGDGQPARHDTYVVDSQVHRITAPTGFGSLDVSELPHLAGIGEQWPVLAARDTYRQGLRALVDGLLSQATSPAA
jgi:hypothetical protein